MVTAVELAKQLRVDPKTFRGWLRARARAGHPLLASHLHYGRWEFSAEEAGQLAAEFSGTSIPGRATGQPAVERATAPAGPSQPRASVVAATEETTSGDTLGDLLAPGLRVVFTGTSVGDVSARRGHYYSHPTNKFWALLCETGLTGGNVLSPERDAEILKFGAGITDLVKRRAASSDSRLDDSDYDVPAYLAKIATVGPAAVAFNGGEAAKRVARHLGNYPSAEGPAGFTVSGAPAYRLPSSSGASPLTFDVKAEAWRAFGRWLAELPGAREASTMKTDVGF